MATTTMKLELVRSNVQIHGVQWAAQYQQKQFKREPCGSNTFDTFYFALFGRWPTLRSSPKN